MQLVGHDAHLKSKGLLTLINDENVDGGQA
jgi:hypothetical protein